MNLKQDDWCKILKLAKIRILLLPVPSISEETFSKYSKAFSQIDTVALSDITNVFNNNHIFLDFVSHNNTKIYTEEFFLTQQIHGIIGILHCPQFKHLAQGERTFKKMLTKVRIQCFSDKVYAYSFLLLWYLGFLHLNL